MHTSVYSFDIYLLFLTFSHITLVVLERAFLCRPR